MEARSDLCGLILEGVSGTGKTTLMKALLRSDGYLDRSGLSSVVLSEHHTQRILEKKMRESGLKKEDNLTLLDGHVTYLEELHGRLAQMEWCRRNQTRQKIPWLLERFHSTHVLHYDYLSWEDVAALDRRLAPLNGKICLLTASPEELEERLFERRDALWNSYITRFGSNRREILGHFLYEQETLLGLAELTVLPVLTFNPSEISLADGVERILNFWFG